jgi:hypothetical protein
MRLSALAALSVVIENSYGVSRRKSQQRCTLAALFLDESNNTQILKSSFRYSLLYKKTLKKRSTKC